MNDLTLDRAMKLTELSVADQVAVFDQRPDAWLVRHLTALGATAGGHARTMPAYRLFRSRSDEGFRVVHDLRSGSALDVQLWTLTPAAIELLRHELPHRRALMPVQLVNGISVWGAIEVTDREDAQLLGLWQPSLAC